MTLSLVLNFYLKGHSNATGPRILKKKNTRVYSLTKNSKPIAQTYCNEAVWYRIEI